MKDSKYLPKDGEPVAAHAWKIIFGAATLLEQTCPKCGDALSAVVFLKDVINIKMGLRIYDKRNFRKWAEIIRHDVEMFSEEDSEDEDLTDTEPVPEDDERAPDEPATPFVVALLHTAHPVVALLHTAHP